MPTDPSHDSPHDPPLQLGSFRLLRPLGSGGMSSVFLARHVESGHEVALKVLPRSLAKNSTILQRFLREARVAEALQHPNIVALYDRGQEQGRYYLVLEYISGGDLHDRVRTNGPLAVAEVIAILRGIVSALKYASAKGLVHRDIKPANLLQAEDGTAKLADLGLALGVDEEDERVTRDGTTVGTVDYMSPEQARNSRSTSASSDMYSLGCTAYFLLAGRPPFPTGGVPEKLRSHALQPPPDIREVRQDVPVEMAHLLQRMMAKKPEQRYVDFDALLAAINQVPSVGSDTADGPLVAIVDDEPASSEILLEVDSSEPAPQPAKPPVRAAASPPKKPDSATGQMKAKRRTRPQPAPASAPEIELSALAALDDDVDDPPPSQRSKARPQASAPSNSSRSMPTYRGGPASGTYRSTAGVPVRRTSSSGDGDLQTWITRGILIGLVVVAAIFAVRALTGGRGTDTDVMADITGETDTSDVAMAPVPAPAPSPSPNLELRELPPIRQRPPWSEPADNLPQPTREHGGRAGLISQFTPAWVAEALAEQTGRTARISRADGLSADDTSELIELADQGPLVLTPGTIPGRARWIRSAPGLRAAVLLTPASNGSPDEAPEALFRLVDRSLVLDGLDLVIDLNAFPDTVTTGFSCSGGFLGLRNCTVTVAGPSDRTFTLARLGVGARREAAQPARFLLDHTLVRGAAVTAVAFDEAGGETVIDRSVIMAGSAPVLDATRAETMPQTPRQANLLRSVLVGSSRLIAGTASSAAPPLVIRGVSNTFGRLDRSVAQGLIVLEKGDSLRDPAAPISWAGDDNVYAGWAGFLASQGGSGLTMRLEDLAAVARVWPYQEQSSQWQPDAWPSFPGLAWLEVSTLASQAASDAQASAVIANVAAPAPSLAVRTIEQLPLLEPPPRPNWSAIQVTREYQFDAALNSGGDLGRYLMGRLMNESRQYQQIVVRARGSGSYSMTPIRLPDGLSMEIVVDAPPEGQEPLSWTARPDTTARALFQVSAGELVIRQGRFRLPAQGGPECLIRVEHGLLVLDRCLLESMAGPGPNRPGCLIHLEAPDTQPLAQLLPLLNGSEGKDRSWVQANDSVLLSRGRVIQADLSNGGLKLVNCGVVAGEAAFELIPGNVSRARFAADLQLDRCTVATGGSVAVIAEWPGLQPGPDRPWLVDTRNCAFLATAPTPDAAKPGSLLGMSDAASRQAVVLWQSQRDYSDLAPVAIRGSDGDVRTVAADWATWWGPSHVRESVIGAPGRRAVSLAEAAPGAPGPGLRQLQLTSTLGWPVGAEIDLTARPVEPSLAAGAPNASVAEPAAPAPAERPPMRPGLRPF